MTNWQVNGENTGKIPHENVTRPQLNEIKSMTTNSDAKHEKIERAERVTHSERHKVVPRHPHKLRGSKWTSVGAVNKELHWEVIEYHKRSGSLVLRALLTKNQQKIDWRKLRDRDTWLPGWQPSPTVD